MRPYNPIRKNSSDTNDPLEVELVYNVSACGTCSFFWPDDVEKQPYGPYSSFDFTVNTPEGNLPGDQPDFLWLEGITTEPGFPTGEIMDGCRKAPIMTIGINPNLTAFAPGRKGSSWAYPNFTDEEGMDMWTKYAYYYRYRTIYQEHFDFDFIKKFFVHGSEIKAAKDGFIKTALRNSEAPSYFLEVVYDGENNNVTKIHIPGALGAVPYILFFTVPGTESRFKAGDMLAVKINIPPKTKVDVYQGLISYYKQFVPSLDLFSQYLKTHGMQNVSLTVGEDVCQLDMVACASPHWTDQYLGGSPASERTVINNCVSKNAWAIKQLVQTKPAVLYLVGESSYLMFRESYSGLIHKNKPLSQNPADGAYTLFKETLDSGDPCLFSFSTTIDGQGYSISTRIIITPHFSFDTNFLPQFRMSKVAWTDFVQRFHECSLYLMNNPDVKYLSPANNSSFVSILLMKSAAAILSVLASKYKEAYKELKTLFYNPHEQMGNVLIEMYHTGQLKWTVGSEGKKGYLTRSEGSCRFCINDHWSFPEGCLYNKTTEVTPKPGFLQAVAKQIILKGKENNENKKAEVFFAQPPGSLFINR